MNDYIVLDGKRYRTPHQRWVPITRKPGRVRVLLSGAVDVTYAPATLYEWNGAIIAPVTPDGSQWGSIGDLRASLAKRQGLSFTDHYGNTYTVHVVGEITEESVSPRWDAPSNEFRVYVTLVRE